MIGLTGHTGSPSVTLQGILVIQHNNTIMCT